VLVLALTAVAEGSGAGGGGGGREPGLVASAVAASAVVVAQV